MATQRSAPSTLPSDTEEVPELAEEQPPPPCFPPYPPMPEPVPPSIADSIGHGRKLRLRDPPPPRPLVHKPPQPARPWTPRVTDIKMSKRVRRAHVRCMKRYGTVLTDRLAQLARPRPRTVVYLWREFAHTLPPETIVRLRAMLDADQPFKPDQAYEYFQNLRKIQKKNAKAKAQPEKSKEVCSTPWPRSATIALARAIKDGLSNLGTYDLDEGLLRLSNVVLNDLCRIMQIHTPPCLCCGKAKNCYMKEIADEIAVWISMIMDEANERMLMMDADEDDGKDIDTDSNEEVKLLEQTKINLADAMDAAAAAMGKGKGDGDDDGLGGDDGKGRRGSGLDDEDEGEMGPPSVGTDPDDDAFKRSVCCEKITQAERNKREEERHRRLCTYIGVRRKPDVDPETEQALQILYRQLRARGEELLCKQEKIILSHTKAASWLEDPEPLLDRTISDAPDTLRLMKILEPKLHALVKDQTPEALCDVMQDVVIESSRLLAEDVVSRNFKYVVRNALISEMQRRNEDSLICIDEETHESFFYCAQRIKGSETMDYDNPCQGVAKYVRKKLEHAMRCRTMPKKLTVTLKEYVYHASLFLSDTLFRPAEKIDCYIALLEKMEETAGDSMLIEGTITRSYNEAAAYLRTVTTLKDEINKPNSGLQSAIANKMEKLMCGSKYSQSVVKEVIAEQSKILTSYAMLEGEKQAVINLIIEKMLLSGDNVLLRHGTIRKTFTDAAEMLKEKEPKVLEPTDADPVVTRKIQIRLKKLLTDCMGNAYTEFTDQVVEEVSVYLAVYLLKPPKANVCDCEPNTIRQGPPSEQLHKKRSCACKRQMSTQVIGDEAPCPSCKGCTKSDTPPPVCSKVPSAQISCRPSHTSTGSKSSHGKTL